MSGAKKVWEHKYDRICEHWKKIAMQAATYSSWNSEMGVISSRFLR